MFRVCYYTLKSLPIHSSDTSDGNIDDVYTIKECLIHLETLFIKKK